MRYTLNFYSAICQLYLNKTEKGKKKKKKRPISQEQNTLSKSLIRRPGRETVVVVERAGGSGV